MRDIKYLSLALKVFTVRQSIGVPLSNLTTFQQFLYLQCNIHEFTLEANNIGFDRGE